MLRVFRPGATGYVLIRICRTTFVPEVALVPAPVSLEVPIRDMPKFADVWEGPAAVHVTPLTVRPAIFCHVKVYALHEYGAAGVGRSRCHSLCRGRRKLQCHFSPLLGHDLTPQCGSQSFMVSTSDCHILGEIE